MLVVWVCGHLVDELRDLGGREGGEEVLQVDVGRRQHVAPEVHRARHREAVSSAKAIQTLQCKERDDKSSYTFTFSGHLHLRCDRELLPLTEDEECVTGHSTQVEFGPDPCAVFSVRNDVAF